MVPVMNEYDLYKNGMSIHEVHEATGIPLSTLRYRFFIRGILRTPQDAIRLAAKKGKLGNGTRGKKKVFTDEWKRNMKNAAILRGEKYAKGFSVKPDGHIEITRGPNKGRPQHDVIMEDYIGRRLERGECVHHINRDKADNRIENLKLMRNGEHVRLHRMAESSRSRNAMGRFI